MNLRKILGFQEPTPSAKLHRQFDIVIDRVTPSNHVKFDAVVDGYFVGSRGRAEFVTQKIAVKGIPNMDISHFLPDEIKQVKKHALSVEFPRMLKTRV